MLTSSMLLYLETHPNHVLDTNMTEREEQPLKIEQEALKKKRNSSSYFQTLLAPIRSSTQSSSNTSYIPETSWFNQNLSDLNNKASQTTDRILDQMKSKRDNIDHGSTNAFKSGFFPFMLGVSCVSAGILYVRYFSRIKRPTDIPSRYLAKGSDRTLFGYVTLVGDGDNFRFFHTPGGRLLGWSWLRRVPESKARLARETINVRIAGIDAPELAHWGNPAQPHSQEALLYLRRLVYHRRLRIQPHRLDQYGRLVASVYIRQWPFFWNKKSVGLALIEAGLADVFEQSGAEYGGNYNEKKLRTALEKAQKAQIGMWSHPDYRAKRANSKFVQKSIWEKFKADLNDFLGNFNSSSAPISSSSSSPPPSSLSVSKQTLKEALASTTGKSTGRGSKNSFETPSEFKRRMRNK